MKSRSKSRYEKYQEAMQQHERLATTLGIFHPQTQDAYQNAINLAPKNVAVRMEQQRMFRHGPFSSASLRRG